MQKLIEENKQEELNEFFRKHYSWLEEALNKWCVPVNSR